MLRLVTSWLVYAGLGWLSDLMRHSILSSTLDSILDSALKLALLSSGFQNSLGAEEKKTELQIFISLATDRYHRVSLYVTKLVLHQLTFALLLEW